MIGTLQLMDAGRARRYLLGLVSEEECATIEEAYLGDQHTFEQMSAAEDELIETYLADRLNAVERDGFERHYLSSPRHRVRVETVRRLMARAAEGASRKSPASSRWWMSLWMPKLVLAASAIVVAGAAWMLSSHRGAGEPPRQIAGSPVVEAPAAVPRPLGLTLALSLSPVAVRSATGNASTVIPMGTDQLTLRLESDGGARRLTPTRVAIGPIGGRELWRGPVAPTTANLPAGSVAQVEVPTASLVADDYLVTLYGTDGSGTEQEWMQYFMRIRRP